MSAYYNEHDPGAAAWLRELIADGQIAAGDVDERSIADVQPGDLAGYTQCHFFAGIGGWSLALRLAGWPDTRPVWTGSCPCQPFSAAGKGEGGADDRHLWPEWFRLIRECRPEHIFGEQVAAAIGHGWLDLVSADLEGEGYALGAHVLGAHSVGAPHRRQRLWFVAESKGVEHERRGRTRGGWRGSTDGRVDLQLGHADDTRPQGRDGAELPERAGECVIGAASASEWVANRAPDGRREECAISGRQRAGDGAEGWAAGSHAGREEAHGEPRTCGEVCELDDAAGARSITTQPRSEGETWDEARVLGPERGCALNPWADLTWLPCRDGKSRPTQSGLFPLVARLSRGVVPSGDPSESEAQASAEARVMRLRGYGNSIIPQVAAEVIRAYMDLV